jgi:serine/threonine-protein kinase
MGDRFSGGAMYQIPNIGELFDERFIVRRAIGRGGMGAVFEAEHADLGRVVALKILARPATPGAFERFLSEAQLTAAVRHPNVVSVLDFGVKDGVTPYLVLERLEGEPLSAMIRRSGKIFWREAVEIGDQILCGLSAAHKAGVVHRDLTPDNVFLCQDDRGGVVAKILDFGVALLARDEQEGCEAGHDLVTGTPGYLAPEAALGLAAIDARADLFSVGVILYELMCGRLPFEGETPGDILSNTLSQPVVRPKRYASDMPAALERLVLTAIAKSPEDRYASASDMLDVLVAAAVGRVHERAPLCRTEIVADKLEDRSTLAPPFVDPLRPPGRVRRHFFMWGALGLVAAAAFLFFGLRGISWVELALTGFSSPRSSYDEVSIWLDVSPRDLSVEWNGELVESRPLMVPRSNKPAMVRFFAPGYESQMRQIKASEDQTVRVELRPLEAGQ